MKATPFLMACTFFLGALLTIVSLSHLNPPVSAQSSGSANGSASGAGVVALTVSVGTGKEFLVVLKEIDNPDPKADENMKRLTAMAVYDFPKAQPGNGSTELALVASRFLEWDFRLRDFARKNEKVGVNDVVTAAENTRKALEKK